MNKYSMTCTCGDVVSVDAENREEAIEKIKGIMNEEMISSHMAEKHPGEEVPSQEQVQMMIEAQTEEKMPAQA